MELDVYDERTTSVNLRSDNFRDVRFRTYVQKCTNLDARPTNSKRKLH